MRTPHSGQNTPITSLPLSAIRVTCFVRPVIVRLFSLPAWTCRSRGRIDAGILCSGRQPSVLAPSSIRNALSRIGIRQCRARACCSLLSNGHDDLSELAALLEIAVRVRHLVEDEGAVDDRLERARLQPPHHELDCSLTSGLVAGRQPDVCALMVCTLAIISSTGSGVTPVLSRP